MNKTELIEHVASHSGLNKSQAKAAVDAFIETVTVSLAAKEDVTIVGFGTFTTTERAAREGRNPRTGETIKIEARTAPRFRAGKALRDAVNLS